MHQLKNTLNGKFPRKTPTIIQPIIGCYLIYLSYALKNAAAFAADVSPLLGWLCAILFAMAGIFIIIWYMVILVKASKRPGLDDSTALQDSDLHMPESTGSGQLPN